MLYLPGLRVIAYKFNINLVSKLEIYRKPETISDHPDDPITSPNATHSLPRRNSRAEPLRTALNILIDDIAARLVNTWNSELTQSRVH